jgi:DUF4097 and DUF4098 domain-containing protein YvlB
MSEETILILTMLRDGKISVDDAERLLAAGAEAAPEPPPAPPSDTVPKPPPVGAPPPRPGNPPPIAPFASVLSTLQSRLGDLQGRLEGLQSDMMAATAARAESEIPEPKEPHGHGSWTRFDFSGIVDETVRDLSGLRDEALRTAKRAVREAAVQGRAAATEARRAARKAGMEFRAGAREAGFGHSFSIRWSERPHNRAGLPEASETITLDEAISESTKLRILNPLGQVTLTGGGAAGQITGELSRSVWAATREEAEYALANVRAVIRHEDGETIIEVTAPPEMQDATADLDLSLPSTLPVEVHTAHGDIRAVGIATALTAHSQSGEIDAENGVPFAGNAMFQASSGDIRVQDWPLSSGDLTLQTTSGDAVVRDFSAGTCTLSTQSGSLLVESFEAGHINAGSASGDIRFVTGTLQLHGTANTQSGSIRFEDVTAKQVGVEAVSGDVTLRNVTGTVSAVTTSGDVEIDGVSIEDLTVKTVSGDAGITVNGPFSGSLIANTVSGDVELKLPDDTAAWIDAATTSGDISCKITLEDRQSEDSRRVGGRIGSGSGTIKIRTISGDIQLDQEP